MPDIHAVVKRTMRLSDPPLEIRLPAPLCFSDKNANAFIITLLNDDNTAASLSGLSVSGTFVRTDDIDITLTGSVSGNKTTVVLSAGCYQCTGPFVLTIKLCQGTSVIRTLAIVRGRTMADIGNAHIDPDHVLPSLTELIAQANASIAAMEAAAATARAAIETAAATARDSIPSDYTALSDAVNEVIGTENLFDATSQNNLDGQYYNSNNRLLTDADLGQSELIPVTPGHKYTTPYTPVTVNWYAANQSFLGYTASSVFKNQGYAEAITNAAYGRFIYQMADKNAFYVHDLDNIWLKRKIAPADTTFFTAKNLFSQNAETLIGQYYNQNGSLTINEEYGQSSLIPVISGHKYSSAETNFFILWYDSSGERIGYTASSEYNFQKYAQPITNAAYARFMFSVADIDSFWVHDLTANQYFIQPQYIDIPGTEPNALVDYNIAPFSGKSWVSFGDSITYRNIWQPHIAQLLGLVHTNCGIGSTCLSGPDMGGNPARPSFWKDSRLNAVKAANPSLITILGGANDILNTITLGDSAEFSRAMPSNAAASQGAAEYDPSGSYSAGNYCTKNGVRYQCNTPITGGEAWNAAHWVAVKNVDTFLGAYSYIIESLLAWKRNVSIVILGTTYGDGDGTNLANTNGITYTQLSDASRQVALYYGLPFVDLHGKAGFNKYTCGAGSNAIYSDDQIHPNAEGGKIIAKLVLNTLVSEVTLTDAGGETPGPSDSRYGPAVFGTAVFQ